jgi:hypothetical protein
MIPLALMLKDFAGPGTVQDIKALIHKVGPAAGSHLLSYFVESSIIRGGAQAYRQY